MRNSMTNWEREAEGKKPCLFSAFNITLFLLFEEAPHRHFALSPANYIDRPVWNFQLPTTTPNPLPLTRPQFLLKSHKAFHWTMTNQLTMVKEVEYRRAVDLTKREMDVVLALSPWVSGELTFPGSWFPQL